MKGSEHVCDRDLLSRREIETFFDGRVELYRRYGCLIVASVHDLVVGFIQGRSEAVIGGTDSEIEQFGVLTGYRKGGIGTALFKDAARSFAAAGMRSAFVRVWSASPANDFYRARGGRLDGEYLAKCGAHANKQQIYRWD